MSPQSLPNITLLVRIRRAQPKSNLTHGNGNNGCWQPPNSTEFYESAPQDTGWLVWEAGERLRRASAQEGDRKEDYKTTSIFRCPDCTKCKAVPFDCLAHNITYSGSPWDGWQPLRFKYEDIPSQDNYRPSCLSIIGHVAQDGCNEPRIGADAPIGLIPSLLPVVNGLDEDKGYIGHAQIAGDPSILFGLMVLSGNSIEAFQPGKRWSPPRQQPGNHSQRNCGFVVSVAFDTDKHRRSEIDDWANGRYGGLITNTP